MAMGLRRTDRVGGVVVAPHQRPAPITPITTNVTSTAMANVQYCDSFTPALVGDEGLRADGKGEPEQAQQQEATSGRGQSGPGTSPAHGGAPEEHGRCSFPDDHDGEEHLVDQAGLKVDLGRHGHIGQVPG